MVTLPTQHHRKVGTMAMHFRRHQLKATRRWWCSCCLRRVAHVSTQRGEYSKALQSASAGWVWISMLKAEAMTMHFRRHQLEATRMWSVSHNLLFTLQSLFLGTARIVNNSRH